MSYAGMHGDKPRHQANYLVAKGRGWKRCREEEELGARSGLGEGPLAKKIQASEGESLSVNGECPGGDCECHGPARGRGKEEEDEDRILTIATGEKEKEKEKKKEKEKENGLKHSSPRGTWVSERERESPFIEIARLLAYLVRLRLRVLCFCGTRNLVEMVNR